jgi:hypothetical protein
MTKKLWMLVGLAVVLGGISLYWNTDWFRGHNIQVLHRYRPSRFAWGRKRAAASATAFAPVFFEFNRKLKLTEISVVPVSDAETNKYPHAIWHMISDSNSVPTKGIMYGESVPGMRPEVKGATPDPLEPGVQYRLMLQAGPLKARHDFAAAESIR